MCVPQWVTPNAVNVDIGANPSAEGGEEDEGVDEQGPAKVVDIVDTFRLQVMCMFFQARARLSSVAQPG